MVQPAILLRCAQEVFYRNLSEKRLYCRKKAGMSQLDLADALGVSRQAVSKWETGESNPDVTKLPQMAALFGVTTDYLLSDEPVEKNAEPSEAPEPPQNPPVYPEWVNNLPRHMMNMVKKFGWLYGLRVAVGGALMTAMGLLGRWMFKTMFFSGAGTSYGGWTTSGDVPQSILNWLNRQSGFVTSGLDSFDSTAWNVASGFTGFIIFLGICTLLCGVVLALVLRSWGEKR